MRSRTARIGRWRPLALPAALALAMACVNPEIAQAAPAPWAPPAAPEVKGVAAPDSVARADRPSWTADSRVVRGPRPVTWPAAGEATVDLTAVPTEGGRGGRASGRVRAGDLPVVLSSAAPAQARVVVHDRATADRLGVGGLVLSVGRTDHRSGPVAVGVDTRGFAAAFGGDWGSRLRLVTLPACALTSPERTECRETKLVPGGRVGPDGMVSGTVAVGTERTVLAVEAAPSGDNGDYSATPLTQAGTWNVGPQTGDFGWSTALRTPPSNGGPAPALSLAYSSGSIDGRTGTSNNQGGWVGDGWSLWSGFIERKYASCAEDNPDHKTGDQCWRGANATLSMNGHAGELIESGTANVWRLKNDDGTRVERLTDTARANGDDDGEYWKVTTTDGTQFFFGAHKQPGWSAGKPVTDSVWTLPVYGNNSGEPCHRDAFAESWCKQAWRWNLDYVLDRHGNTMTYFYGKETGGYGRDNTPSQRTEYTRGGWIERIEYGTRHGSEVTTAAPMRVSFQTAERCLSGCWSGTPWTSNAVTAAWPDTPWDQHCAAAPCTGKTAPTFWSARRLTGVTTQLRTAAGGYRDVESWSLRHEFLNAGDNEGSPLWLRGLTKTGHVTTAGGVAVSDPEIVFNPGAEPLPNRVDGPTDGRTSLTRFRLKGITTESGGQIAISYSGPDCTRASLPDPATNTKRCMPSYYSPAGTPTLDWFHKYVVTSVTAHDTTADGTTAPSNPDQTTFYDYLDAPAWHYTDDELTKAAHRTWGGWRGYGRVLTRTGAANGPQTAVETRYLRGMDGDKLPSGTRDVWVADTWGGSVEDHESLNGFTRQTITYNGRGGAEVSSAVNDPWRAGPTATRTRDGITTNAWRTGVGTARTRTPLAAGGHRTASTTTVRDPHGFPEAVTDHGDLARTGDETCTRTTYARDEAGWVLDKVSSAETRTGTCDATGTVLSRARNYFDDATVFGAAPTKGDLVRVEELDRWDGTTPVYVTAARTTYDANGRTIETRDGLDRKSTTAYTTDPATGLVTSKAETNALGHITVTVHEPAWRSPLKVTDPNGVAAELTYDGLGRVTAVWKPGRARSQSPSLRFGYLSKSAGGPSAITTETLLPSGTAYRTSVSLLDGFLRPRQTQEQATGGGRTVTDTLHDAAGRVERKSAPYYDSTNSPVSTNLAAPAGAIPSDTRTEYDGAGRPTAEILLGGGTEKWRTTTIYNGDRVSKVPPSGGTAITTVSDVDGNTTAQRQYRSAASVGGDDPGTYDETRYGYTPLGKLASVTDPAGNAWTFAYDLRGRQTEATDPDKGRTTSEFDAAGQLIASTAPHGTGTTRLAYTYDALSRKTSVREGSATGAPRAEWTYDATPVGAGPQTAKGKLTSAVRHSGGAAYASRVDSYDTAGRATSSSVVLPPQESDLCAAAGTTPCVYTTAVSYKPNGDVATTTLPAAADLPSEKLTHGYTDIGAAGTLLSPAQIYVYSVGYNKLGQLTQRQLGAFGARVAQTYAFDEQTSRLAGVTALPEARDEVLDLRYTYDGAGNLTSVADSPGTQAPDNQCFTFDYLRRLTEAWTPGSGDCAAARTVPALGGPAPYWHSWAFDVTGNRSRETRHAATDTVVDYDYPAPGQPRPHAVTQVTASGGQSWDRAYRYDSAGNLTERPTAAATQSLTWDVEGHLTSVGNSGATVYDADGTRLVRADADGTKTLYLPNGTEVRSKAGVRAAKRHYTHAGNPIALRTAAGVQWLLTDHHGTAQVAIDAGTLAATRNLSTPYGEQRGTATGWPTALDRGFVGGTKDPTGLTHIGAREYDPALGRFISVDPVMDPKDPQQLNAYVYSNNNPVSFSDPDGRKLVADEGGSGPATQPAFEAPKYYLVPGRTAWYSRVNREVQSWKVQIHTREFHATSFVNWAADGIGGLGFASQAAHYLKWGQRPASWGMRAQMSIVRSLSVYDDLDTVDARGKTYNPLRSQGAALRTAIEGSKTVTNLAAVGNSKLMGRLGIAGNVLDAGVGLANDLHNGEDPREAVVKATLKVAGSMAGAAIGAAAGTALCGGFPGCGVIGGAIGGTVGGDLAEVAAPVANKIMDKVAENPLGRLLCFICTL